ncbi:cytochrome P450 4g1-like [Planococcus citri]|uniref:cytochrome P450 4g1-like n=1 Tax=Planococcus citri TaxID=170843 RepID=UPI0031F7C61A
MNFIQISACISVIVILLSYIRKLKNKRFYKLLEQFPSHPTYPLIGNAHMFFGSMDDILPKLEKIMKLNDRVVHWFGPIPCLFLKKHEDIAMTYNLSSDRDLLGTPDDWLGVGILTSKYEEWKMSRKMFSPAFSSNMLLKYAEVIEKHSLKFVDNLKSAANSGEEIDVFNCLTRLSMDTIMGTLFGDSIETDGKMREKFCFAAHDAIQYPIKRLQYPWLLSHRLNRIFLHIIGKINTIHDLQYYPTTILKKTIKNFQNVRRDSNTPDEVDTSNTMIDVLVRYWFKNSSNFTETRMRDEVLHIIAAAVETSSMSTSFTVFMLALHQDVQQKAFDEVSKLVTDDGTFTPNDVINNMPYLDQCINETIRLYSPVAAMPRRMHKDITLNDNAIIPANTLVLGLIQFANWDPDVYKNPEKFDPQNFSKEAEEARPKTSRLNFGYGPRSCIGAKYAMLSNKMLMALILRNYHLSTSVKEFTKEHLKMDLSTQSKIGYPVKFTRRRARSSLIMEKN